MLIARLFRPVLARVSGRLQRMVLGTVTKQYLTSTRFNGMPVFGLLRRTGGSLAELRRVLSSLIEKELVSLNFGDRHPNPHILAFPPESTSEQLTKLNSDLVKGACVSCLSPEHQQAWHGKILGPEFKLHPDYYRIAIIGDWRERISVFSALLLEMETVNRMAEAMGRKPLFRNVPSEDGRPRELTFLIRRPTQKEFNDFILAQDKLLSENINLGFFGSDVPLERVSVRRDGTTERTRKGSIAVLDEWVHTPTSRCPTPLQSTRPSPLSGRSESSVSDPLMPRMTIGSTKPTFTNNGESSSPPAPPSGTSGYCSPITPTLLRSR